MQQNTLMVLVASSLLGVTACSDEHGARIGPAGGTVTNGRASVTIPAGALDTLTQISIATADVSNATLPNGITQVGDAFAFTPDGTVFKLPVTIRVPFAGNATTLLRLDDENDPSWEVVPDTEISGGSVGANVLRFSIYASGGSPDTADAGPDIRPDGGTDLGLDAMSFDQGTDNAADTLPSDAPTSDTMTFDLFNDIGALLDAGIDSVGTD